MSLFPSAGWNGLVLGLLLFMLMLPFHNFQHHPTRLQYSLQGANLLWICIYFIVENLITVVQDLALGAGETASNALAFALRYLVQYPGIQMKLYNEINAVVGPNRLPTLEDKPT